MGTGLDYGWTCGDIDKGIAEFKAVLEDHLADMIGEMLPST